MHTLTLDINHFNALELPLVYTWSAKDRAEQNQVTYSIHHFHSQCRLHIYHLSIQSSVLLMSLEILNRKATNTNAASTTLVITEEAQSTDCEERTSLIVF